MVALSILAKCAESQEMGVQSLCDMDTNLQIHVFSTLDLI